MVQINFAQRQVNAKVVYYGPGMSGKTTNLEVVHQRAPEQNKGELTSISTDGDRTLFFDFMPLDLGTVAGMRTCFQIYTVPGQVYYNSTRKLVLQGVDGVVFVADSSAAMQEENKESLRNLEENLNEYGKSLANLPHVIQYNKRDLPDAMPVEELNALLNAHNAPFFEAVAKSGQGVFPTLKALAARVLESIHQTSGGTSAPRPQAAAPAPAPAPAPRMAAPPTAAGIRPMHEPPGAVPSPLRTASRSGAPAHPQQMGMGGVDPFASTMASPPPMAHAQHAQPMSAGNGMAPPSMNPAGILTQTGFHSAALNQAPPPAPAQGGQPNLHLASARNVNNAGPGGTTSHSRNDPEAVRKPRAAAPAAKPAPKAMESTRFRPRGGAPRSEPRATPVAKATSKISTGVYIAIAVVLAVVLTLVVQSIL